jgi:HAD superfamily hydrolase (TIGR01509 family)
MIDGRDSRFQVIIFDCDGVLVDSEVIACEIVAAGLVQAGFPITSEEYFARYTGVSDRETYAHLEQRYGMTVPGELRRRITDDILTALTTRLEPIPGIREALEAIPLAKCVASGSDLQRVRASLSRTGLLHHFAAHIYTSEAVARGKPAPDLFLLAAERLHTDPARCLVIEDSRAGVQGAIAAGMTAWGFIGASHCGADRADLLREAGAARIFDSMWDLPALLADSRSDEPPTGET